jgi:hypothetical protein
MKKYFHPTEAKHISNLHEFCDHCFDQKHMFQLRFYCPFQGNVKELKNISKVHVAAKQQKKNIFLSFLGLGVRGLGP